MTVSMHRVWACALWWTVGSLIDLAAGWGDPRGIIYGIVAVWLFSASLWAAVTMSGKP